MSYLTESARSQTRAKCRLAEVAELIRALDELLDHRAVDDPGVKGLQVRMCGPGRACVAAGRHATSGLSECCAKIGEIRLRPSASAATFL